MARNYHLKNADHGLPLASIKDAWLQLTALVVRVAEATVKAA